MREGREVSATACSTGEAEVHGKGDIISKEQGEDRRTQELILEPVEPLTGTVSVSNHEHSSAPEVLDKDCGNEQTSGLRALTTTSAYQGEEECCSRPCCNWFLKNSCIFLLGSIVITGAFFGYPIWWLEEGRYAVRDGWVHESCRVEEQMCRAPEVFKTHEGKECGQEYPICDGPEHLQPCHAPALDGRFYSRNCVLLSSDFFVMFDNGTVSYSPELDTHIRHRETPSHIMNADVGETREHSGRARRREEACKFNFFILQILSLRDGTSHREEIACKDGDDSDFCSLGHISKRGERCDREEHLHEDWCQPAFLSFHPMQVTCFRNPDNPTEIKIMGVEKKMTSRTMGLIIAGSVAGLVFLVFWLVEVCTSLRCGSSGSSWGGDTGGSCFAGVRWRRGLWRRRVRRRLLKIIQQPRYLHGAWM